MGLDRRRSLRNTSRRSAGSSAGWRTPSRRGTGRQSATSTRRCALRQSVTERRRSPSVLARAALDGSRNAMSGGRSAARRRRPAAGRPDAPRPGIAVRRQPVVDRPSTRRRALRPRAGGRPPGARPTVTRSMWSPRVEDALTRPSPSRQRSNAGLPALGSSSAPAALQEWRHADRASDRPSRLVATITAPAEAAGPREGPDSVAQTYRPRGGWTTREGIVALEPGLLLGGMYSVISPISRGAMGEVVRARHLESGSEVAIKRLLDLRNAARFEIEARLLAGSTTRAWSGGRARRRRERPLPAHGVSRGRASPSWGRPREPRARGGRRGEYARQACEALAYVHEQKMIHRDVKPQNLISRRAGRGAGRLRDRAPRRRARRDGDDRHRHARLHGAGDPRRRRRVAAQRRLLAGGDAVGAAGRAGPALRRARPPSEGLRDAARGDAATRASSSTPSGGSRRPRRSRRPSGPSSPPAAGASLALTVRARARPGTCSRRSSARRRWCSSRRPCRSRSRTPTTGGLVFESAWGAGAREVVGLRRPGVGHRRRT